MVEKFAKVFNMKIAPMLLLMTRKDQTSQARYLQFIIWQYGLPNFQGRDRTLISFWPKISIIKRIYCILCLDVTLMPTPSADPKFSSSILKFLSKLKFLKYTQIF